ncbi:unnamed protein product [Diatraea saccharalis]|uniref:RNA-binding protein 48 n=1 Tax=Diatraea saccharalis TaxID=40085 RepID=A0A9N9WGD2_9NEOP|nr:unnamed protein product [Diatraea saccharalis]
MFILECFRVSISFILFYSLFECLRNVFLIEGTQKLNELIKFYVFNFQVYTVNDESNHLLIFGVPSLNLRQEAKTMFLKFGKLLQFSITKEHAAEDFTETYHAVYEKIQSARLAKKFTDTKNFYGGCLHVCYAPEFETVDETRNKLLQRRQDVHFRLRNLQKQNDAEKIENQTTAVQENSVTETNVKLNMGEINNILINNEVKRKRKTESSVTIQKKFKPCFVQNDVKSTNSMNTTKITMDSKSESSPSFISKNIEIVDCTSTNIETITNINESLNYKNFGNEIVRKIPQKPVNRIKFRINN